MAVRVSEVDAPPAAAVVDLPVLQGPRPTPIRDISGLYAVEDGVELCLTHMKGVVVALEPVAVVEVQGQGLVHLHGREVPHRSGIRQTEEVREESCRFFLVVRGD